MRTPIIMAAVGLLLVFSGVVAIASSIQTGDSFDLSETFAPYIPGQPLPTNISCNDSSPFYGGTEIVCRTNGNPYCEQGYIVVRNSVISRATFFHCNFPLAFLIDEYGRFDRMRRYKRVVVLRWPNMFAHVRRNGWPNLMEAVHIVTWWRPPSVVQSQLPS